MDEIFVNLAAKENKNDNETLIYLTIQRRMNIVCDFCTGMGH